MVSCLEDISCKYTYSTRQVASTVGTRPTLATGLSAKSRSDPVPVRPRRSGRAESADDFSLTPSRHIFPTHNKPSGINSGLIVKKKRADRSDFCRRRGTPPNLAHFESIAYVSSSIHLSCMVYVRPPRFLGV